MDERHHNRYQIPRNIDHRQKPARGFSAIRAAKSDFCGVQDGFERSKRPARLPVVLTPAEARSVLSQLEGTKWLMASLLYGAGLRLMECLRLRVKDVDFGYGQILVRDGKGAKDRVTMLPQVVIEPLRAHLVRVRALHDRDLAAGFGEAWLPHALERKYPRAARESGWQGSTGSRAGFNRS